MSPLLHFRSWLRSGPAMERGMTAAAGMLVLALVVWASLPTGSNGLTGAGEQLDASAAAASQGSGAVADPAGSTGAAGSGAAVAAGPSASGDGSALPAVSPAPGGASPAAGGGAAAAGSTSRTLAPASAADRTGTGSTGKTTAVQPAASTTACGALAPTDQGVTARTITVGVVLVDLGSAGDLIDLPSKADQMKAYDAIVDDVNKNGGVRCRKVIAKYYTDGVADTSQEHAQCLQMQQDKIFIAFNNMFNTTEQTCIAKAGIPNIWYTTPHTGDVRKYAPYILSWHPHYDQLIEHYVRGANAVGWFKGMKKLGILQGSCYPDEAAALDKELRGIGMDPSKASRFNFGCTAGGTATPDQSQSAALQFKRDGVTHILNVAYANDASVSTAADQQLYYPAFAHMEDASATAIETGTQKPGKSYDKTLLITAIQTGARNTKGIVYNKPTQECTRILKGAGLPAAYEVPHALYFGVGCTNLLMFKTMAERAPELKRDQMALGLSKVGALDLPFPAGPAVFSDPRLPTGGQQWRPGAWSTACECWKVTDQRYRTGY